MARNPSGSLRRYCAVWIVALGALAASCSNSSEGLFGQELYEGTCAVCHGADGQGLGGRPALNEGSEAATFTDDQLRGVIRVGPGAMPSFSNLLDEEQVQSLIEYLRELQSGTAGGD